MLRVEPRAPCTLHNCSSSERHISISSSSSFQNVVCASIACVWTCLDMPQYTHPEARGQFERLSSFLLPGGLQGSTLGGQTWQQGLHLWAIAPASLCLVSIWPHICEAQFSSPELQSKTGTIREQTGFSIFSSNLITHHSNIGSALILEQDSLFQQSTRWDQRPQSNYHYHS